MGPGKYRGDSLERCVAEDGRNAQQSDVGVISG